MEKYTCSFRLKLFAGFLALLLTVSGCKPEEQEVNPQQTCDTQATVQELSECGLVLVLKSNQKLVPVNALTLPETPSGLKQFKINGFSVKEGQRVIIGFTNKGVNSNTCLKGAQLAWITCIVGYKVQS